MEVALAVLFIGLAVGVPVAYLLMGSALVYYIAAPQPVEVVLQRLNSGLDSFPLAAIPFFTLAGAVMARGGIARRLLGFADALIGHRRGGLAQVNVLNSMFIGGMSGSGVADAAIDSKVLVPVMVRHGYGKSFSGALSAATGAIAPLVPPSIALILYGLIANVSVGRLFLGGIVPAILLALALSVAVARIAAVRGYKAERERRLPLPEIAGHFKSAALALLMPVLLLVGLRAGVFTPTELGALAAVYTIVITWLAYKEFAGIKDFLMVVREAVLSSAVIMLLIAGGIAFSGAITVEGLPQAIGEWLLSISDNPAVILLIINLALLILGSLFDGMTLLVVLTPILAPAAAALGIDPVHFGLIMLINITIGAFTPPVGLYLFTVSSITGAPMSRLSREVLPFVAAAIVVLMLVTYIPTLVLTLPNLVLG